MNFDTNKYKVWTWKHITMLHWMINPGAAVLELLLGLRVPKVMLIEKGVKKPLGEKGFIPCPHCHTLHSSMKWTPQNNTGFKNWFGLYCDHCGKIIPCLWNFTSLIILAVTFPIWIWFKNRWKQKWLQVQKEKFSKQLSLTVPHYKWWYIGLRYTFWMIIFMILFDVFVDHEPFTWKLVLKNSAECLFGGIIFGLVFQKWLGAKASTQRASK